MDRERLDAVLEKCILGLVTLVLVLAPLLFGSTLVRDQMILSGLTSIALGVWIVRLWVRSEYRILWPPFAWAVLAFVAYAVWRYKMAEVEYIARLDLNCILLFAAIFFLILDNLNRQEWTQFLVYTLIFVGMVMAMYAIYQYLTGSKFIYNTPQPPGYYGRASGPFVCPNHLAGYLAMTIPLAFAMTLMGRLKPVMKVFLGYAAIVMLCGLVTTVSRGGIAAAAVGLLALFGILLFNREFRLPAAVALVLIVIPAVWMATKSFSMQARMKKAVVSGEFGDDRFLVWPIAKTIWRANYWTGVGPGHFDMHFRSLRPPLGQMQGRPYRVHDDYLNVLADYGIIGFGLVLGAWGVFWLGAVRIWKFVRRANDLGSRQSTRGAIVLGASAGLIALLAHVTVDFDTYIPALALVIVTLLAMVSGHWRFATERFWIKPGIFGRMVATLFCLAAVAWFGSQIQRLGPESYYLKKADQASGGLKEFDWLMKAYAAEPKNPQTPYRIGELFRKQSWNALAGYQKQAEEAITWFDKSIALDPYDPHGYLGKGLCLDWLERYKEAWPYFHEIMRLDPNSYFTRAHYGWHFFQLGDIQRAYKYFQTSLGLRSDNPMALPYYNLLRQKLVEQQKAAEAQPR